MAATEHSSLLRPEIDALLFAKLPDILSKQQKITKIGHLLTSLRKEKKIEVGEKKAWILRQQ